MSQAEVGQTKKVLRNGLVYFGGNFRHWLNISEFYSEIICICATE